MTETETSPGDASPTAETPHDPEQTRAALLRAHDLIDRITQGGAVDPSLLDRLIGPSSRIRARLEADLLELELIAQGLGI